MLDYQIQAVLQDLLLVGTTTYRDESVDDVMLEIKNLKNTNNLSAAQLLGNSVTVLLNRIPLQRFDVEEWSSEIARTCKPFENLWHYLRYIADNDDREELVFRVYEYCQNPKRPHLRDGFGYIVSALLAGGILCEVSAAGFIQAMENSDDSEEQKVGSRLVPFLSRSCPW